MTTSRISRPRQTISPAMPTIFNTVSSIEITSKSIVTYFNFEYNTFLKKMHRLFQDILRTRPLPAQILKRKLYPISVLCFFIFPAPLLFLLRLFEYTSPYIKVYHIPALCVNKQRGRDRDTAYRDGAAALSPRHRRAARPPFRIPPPRDRGAARPRLSCSL